jgi:hypothetical protein
MDSESMKKKKKKRRRRDYARTLACRVKGAHVPASAAGLPPPGMHLRVYHLTWYSGCLPVSKPSRNLTHPLVFQAGPEDQRA